MKRILLTLACAALLSSCVKPQATRDLLTKQGYTDIQITGYRGFSCSEDDMFATGFAATTITGQRVTGTVCGGFLKGATIRLDD